MRAGHSLSTTMYCEAMRKIPGNAHFRDRIEYTSVVEYYFGRSWYVASQIGLNGALQSLNIISVIQSAQVLDKAISAIGGKSCAFNLTPFGLMDQTGTGNSTVGLYDADFGPAFEYGSSNSSQLLPASVDFWSCVDIQDLNNDNGWGCHVVLTLGFILAALITVPMGYFNLDDNMIVQQGAFVLTLGCWVVWILACFWADPAGQVGPPAPGVNASAGQGTWGIPAINSDPNFGSQAGVLGTILFNFGFVTTIPSWVNEKKPTVSVNKTVWLSSFLCIIIFFSISIPGTMAFKYFLAGPATGTCAYAVDTAGAGSCSGGLMDLYLSSNAPKAWTEHAGANALLQLSVYLFPIVAVLSSIPVFSIVIKYNAIENGFSKTFAVAWGVLFPWVVAVPLLYQPNALNSVINFSSLIFVSFTDFVVPWCLFIIMNQQERGASAAGAVSQGAAINEAEESPFPTGRKSNIYEDDDVGDLDETSPLFAQDIPEHVAIPESWGWTHSTKIQVASVLVIVMTIISLVATGMSIQQAVAGGLSFDNCVGVGS